MRNSRYYLVAILFIITTIVNAQRIVTKTHIKLNNQDEIKDSISLTYTPLDSATFGYQRTITKPSNSLTFVLDINSTGTIRFPGVPIIDDTPTDYYISPGDDVVISVSNKKLLFSGKGSEKFRLNYYLRNTLLTLLGGSNISLKYKTNSLNDYNLYRDYIYKKIRLGSATIDDYRDSIDNYTLKYIKVAFIAECQNDLIDKFAKLYSLYRSINPKDDRYQQKLKSLFDADFYTEPFIWMRSQPLQPSGEANFIKWLARRNNQFDINFSSKNPERNLIYYNLAKKTYTGNAYQNAIMSFVMEDIHEARKRGFKPNIISAIKLFYKEVKNQAFEKEVKLYEDSERIKAQRYFPAFLVTQEGSWQGLSLNALKGKVVFLEYWNHDELVIEGWKTSMNMLKEKFRGDTNVLFLSVSTEKDREKWLNAITLNPFNKDGVINVYTDGKGVNHQLVEDNSVKTLPSLYIYQSDHKPLGKLIFNPSSDQEEIIRLAMNQLQIARLNNHRASADGPYVLRKGNAEQVYTFENGKIFVNVLNRKSGVLTVQTDLPDLTFSAKLKTQLVNESASFKKPLKLLAISDIEGEFGAFRELLQNNGVIDQQLNWCYGQGHLVLNGDFFDRGVQVNEVLWLIYKLEDEAKKAGGYVHYILGNHEIMNLSGHLEYTQDKYKKIATSALNKTYHELYGEQSELGRWLRTKNIAEKIGDVLFVHAGISQKFNDQNLSLDDINKLARPFYDRDTFAIKSPDKKIALLFDSSLSPLWYRDYYLEDERKVTIGPNGLDTIYRTTPETIDQTLKLYGLKHIVTGHTHVDYTLEGKYHKGDAITTHFENKIINTDTYHSNGISEALLIEDGYYYRVNGKGDKQLLFKEGETKTFPETKAKKSTKY